MKRSLVCLMAPDLERLEGLGGVPVPMSELFILRHRVKNAAIG